MEIKVFSIGNDTYPNEDRYKYTVSNQNTAIAVLADGMGGLSLGNTAAEVVSVSIHDYIIAHQQEKPGNTMLLDALNHADKDLEKVSLSLKSNMGAAVAVAFVSERILYATWQGNVRIYLYRDGRLSTLTADHILNIGYGQTALSRCIKGGGLRHDIPTITCELKAGDKVFLCSDGFYKIAEKHLVQDDFDSIKEKIIDPKDDATLIRILV
nr:MAG TPA: Serine/threonine protein phosphatase [Bacteriophage sp.]